ncbi:hypothetical protein [Arthrobacter sulfonylureivorans]|uniref:Uncharacterized protein n=1 Tax=Arthrobacter sulfonylureivorans TaxID=2486855 RepID=A0ABY3WAT1_9MICC|nr:hypothetical protein [Arthrobacter sulfonylureivorans]UNK47121.1 hypothetical protein MNQ99_07195 [Arthrobacter sulfonylureivorans]
MSWTTERAKIAALSRSRNADDPEIFTARQRLKAARLEDHIRATIDAFPPLTPDQLDRIGAIIHTARTAGGDAA